jgi:hypothetical protein
MKTISEISTPVQHFDYFWAKKSNLTLIRQPGVFLTPTKFKSEEIYDFKCSQKSFSNLGPTSVDLSKNITLMCFTIYIFLETRQSSQITSLGNLGSF